MEDDSRKITIQIQITGPKVLFTRVFFVLFFFQWWRVFLFLTETTSEIATKLFNSPH